MSLAQHMIANGERTGGEYYVNPAYQQYIERGWRVDIFVARQRWHMGTPEAMSEFEQRSPA